MLDVRILFARTTSANMNDTFALTFVVRFEDFDDPKSPTPTDVTSCLCVAPIDGTHENQEDETV